MLSMNVQLLSSGDHQMQLNVADKMIENVVGVFGLPMGVALNFLINNRDYVVLVVRSHRSSLVYQALPAWRIGWWLYCRAS